jgi:hypothetical protein
MIQEHSISLEGGNQPYSGAPHGTLADHGSWCTVLQAIAAIHGYRGVQGSEGLTDGTKDQDARGE